MIISLFSDGQSACHSLQAFFVWGSWKILWDVLQRTALATAQPEVTAGGCCSAQCMQLRRDDLWLNMAGWEIPYIHIYIYYIVKRQEHLRMSPRIDMRFSIDISDILRLPEGIPVWFLNRFINLCHHVPLNQLLEGLECINRFLKSGGWVVSCRCKLGPFLFSSSLKVACMAHGTESSSGGDSLHRTSLPCANP